MKCDVGSPKSPEDISRHWIVTASPRHNYSQRDTFFFSKERWASGFSELLLVSGDLDSEDTTPTFNDNKKPFVTLPLYFQNKDIVYM